MKQKLNHSIAFRLFLGILAFSFVVTVLTSGLQIYLSYRDSLRQLEHDFESIQNAQLQNLTHSLWVMDMDHLQVHLNGFLNDPHINFLKIESKNKTLLSAGRLDTDNFVRREFPLTHLYNTDRLQLGTFSVYSDLRVLYKNLFGEGLNLLIYQAFQTFLIAFFIFFIVRQFITKHLASLAGHLSKLEATNPPDPISLNRNWLGFRKPDELDHVVHSINTMSKRLKETYTKLEEELERRKQSEEALRDSEYMVRLVADNVPALVSYVGNDLQYKFVNSKYQDYFGKSLDDIVNRHMRDIVGEEYYHFLKVHIDTVLSGKQAHFETPFSSSLGKRWINVTYVPNFDEHKGVQGFFIMAIDLTERKQAEEALKEATSRYQTLVDTIPHGLQEIEVNGTITFANPAHHTIHGYEQGELIGKSMLDFSPSKQQRQELANYLHFLVAEQPEPTPWVGRTMTKDGNFKDIQVDWSYKRDTQGQVVGFSSIITDITEQKWAEEKLKENEEQFRLIIDNLPALISYVDCDQRYLHANKQYEKWFGLPSSKIVGKRVVEILGETNYEKIRPEINKALAGQYIEYEDDIRLPNGETRNFHSRNIPHINEKQEVLGYFVMVEDITERKQAEEALRLSEARLRSAVDNIPFDFFMLDEQERYILLNKSILKHWGDLVGKKPEDVAPNEETLALWKSNNNKALSGETVNAEVSFEVFGQIRSFINVISPVHFDGRIIGILGLNIDITERKIAEKKLRESEERFRELAENIHEVFWLFNLQTNKVVYVSPAYEEIWGRSVEDLYERYEEWAESIYPEDRSFAEESFENIITAGGGEEREYRIVRPDGEIRWIMDRGFPITAENGEIIRIAGIAEDITDRKRSEEALLNAHADLEKRVLDRTADLQHTYKQLLHAEKLAAIGQLSASIAHEFNNPLYGVMNILSGIKRRAPLDDEDTKLVEMGLTECSRMKNLINDLQDFNRPTSGKLAPMDIHAAIDSVLLLSKKDLKTKGINVEKNYGSKAAPLIAIADQIKQVILNLLNNATDACDGGGTIKISTRRVDNNVIMRIQDTGRGIKEEDMEYIFEPFFTTKPEVKGTGLGLSVSYGIIKGHGGTIEVKSEPGKGSTFTVMLPTEGGKNED